MTAYKLLSETLRAILRNWKQVLPIFLVPIILLVGLFSGAVMVAMQEVLIEGHSVSFPSPLFFLLFPIFFFLVFWPVVAWHRLLILNETVQGFVPPLRLKNVLRYVLNLFALGLVIALITLPFFAILNPLILGALGPQAMARGEVRLFSVLFWSTVIFLPALYLSIRFCLILPGAAIGDHIGLRGSWRFTANLPDTILSLVVLSAVISLASQLFLIYLTPRVLIESAFFQMVQLLVQLFSSLFVVSLMSKMFIAFDPDRTKGKPQPE